MEAKDIISSGLLELFVTGVASEQEVSLVQQYVQQYPEVAAELAAIEAGMELYAQAFAVKPNPSVKDKIFSLINDTSNSTFAATAPVKEIKDSSAPVIGISSYWKFAAAASAALLFGSIALNIIMYNRQGDIAKNLQQAEQELAGLKEENKVMTSDMQVVQSKYSKPVALKGLDAAPDAAAKIFWMENTGEVYIDPGNLPEVPAGKQYQLWGIVDGKPVSGGMILTSKKGDKYRIQKMKTFGRVEAFAVTLENEPDNLAPKGPMFVMGKM